jgi:phenylalanyl-tRNA synthetase beta chain
VVREGIDEIRAAVPYSKPDISIPADIVEEIVRIDGLDNIEIPETVTLSPARELLGVKEALKNKIATYLVGQGFVEIFTNSITNSAYFDEATLAHTVKMINNLSEELNVLRPSMVETGLESIAYNLNRRNLNLSFFEYGKTYTTQVEGLYAEEEHLTLYLTGKNHEDGWREKGQPQDFFRMKGIAGSLMSLCGLTHAKLAANEQQGFDIHADKQFIGSFFTVSNKQQKQFDIKQPVVILDIKLEQLQKAVEQVKIRYKEVNRFPVMQRDLALVVNRNTTFAAIEETVQKAKISRLKDVRLFDVFESDKLGTDKKSMAISFTFSDEEKTLTDKEVDAMVSKLIQGFEKDLSAEIRK